MSAKLFFLELMQSNSQYIAKPHFDKIAFTLNNKIFVTLNEKEERITIKFTKELQKEFCDVYPDIVYAVPNKWGTHGWTHVDLEKVDPLLLQEIIVAASNNF